MTAPLREPSFSANLGGGHAVPACTEVGDSPDVQVEFLVMEHRLVRVLHQEVGVADDVPLEYLVPWCEIPAHEFQRTMFHLVGEDHPADPMPKAYRRSRARVGLRWAWERPFKGLSPKEAETSKNRLRLVYGTIPENRSEEVQETMERWASESPSKGLAWNPSRDHMTVTKYVNE